MNSKLKSILSVILAVTLYTLNFSQTEYKSRLEKYVDKGDIDSADYLFEKLIKADTCLTEDYIIYANLLFDKGKSSMLNVSTKQLKQEIRFD